MKVRNLFLLLISTSLLSSCEFLDKIFDNNTQDTEQQDIPSSTDDTEDYEIPNNKVGEFYGGLVNDNIHIGYEFSGS